jgi:DMSO/TMAO reductase YedYZ molybdopterin-dependent catalytic subunit
MHPADARQNRADPSRRAFLVGAAAALPLIEWQSIARAQEPDVKPGTAAESFPGMITRQRMPDNLEFPFASLDSFLTPNGRFYVRTHFEEPEIDADEWRLSVAGKVRKPLTLSYDELREMPSRTVTALLECSGNSRVFLKPPQSGLRWEQGAVGNAEWTGVPLSALLERAGADEQAVDIVLEGTDQGESHAANASTPGKVSFARSLPLEVARRAEVILAYQMNGSDLPRAHGFPVRAIVPGWYGMASVKWLKRIVVLDRPFHGYFQTFMYTGWAKRDGLPTLVPVTEIEVKSQIARPTSHETVPARSTYLVHGAAWAGKAQIAKVEISTDNGGSWSAAELDRKSLPFAWRFWHYEWKTPARGGTRVLLARATDDAGRVQPMTRDDDRRDAVINHVQPITVEVR